MEGGGALVYEPPPDVGIYLGSCLISADGVGDLALDETPTPPLSASAKVLEVVSVSAVSLEDVEDTMAMFWAMITAALLLGAVSQLTTLSQRSSI